MAKHVQAKSIATDGTVDHTPASKIAREAIPLLEKAIRDRFGLTVKMGAELEFSVIPSDRLLAQYRRGEQTRSLEGFIDPLKMSLAGGKTYDYTPSNQKPAKRKVRFFGESTAICYGHEERDPGNTEAGTFKYEYVFTHNTGQDLQFLADEITDTKRMMQGKSPAFTDAPRLSNNLKYPFPKGYWKWISFDPSLPYYPIGEVAETFGADMGTRSIRSQSSGLRNIHPTHGLHFNVSLLSDSGGMVYLNQRNIAADFPTTVASGIYRATKDAALALDSANSFVRREKGYVTRAQVVVRDEGDSINMRIENRLPDASCNPHIGAMINLVGIYYALDAMKFDKSTLDYQAAPALQSIDMDDKIPIHRNDQIATFKSETIVKDTLNKVEEGLGDEFHKAVMDEKTKHLPKRNR